MLIPDSAVPWCRAAVVLLLCAIGLMDMGAGAWLMLSSSPWTQNGFEHVWAAIPSVSQNDPAVLTLLSAAFGRMGAFSFNAGAVTITWSLMARRDMRWLTALLVLYSVTGIAFFNFDRTYLSGTRYAELKSVISVVWVVGLVLHFGALRRVSEPARLSAG